MSAGRPILFLDVDGVFSLFGFDTSAKPPGDFHWVDGIAHCISPDSGRHIVELADSFDLVWATGWEEKANEYLPGILGLPFAELPCLSFEGRATFGSSHWKLDAIEEYAGARPIAWIDDHMEPACREWAHDRDAPTLLIETQPAVGITDEHTRQLLEWAESLDRPSVREA